MFSFDIGSQAFSTISAYYFIGFNIGWQEKWVWSVLPSGIDIGYDIVGFSTIS